MTASKLIILVLCIGLVSCSSPKVVRDSPGKVATIESGNSGETKQSDPEKRIQIDTSSYEMIKLSPDQYRGHEEIESLVGEGYEVWIGLLRKDYKSSMGSNPYIAEIAFFVKKNGELKPLGILSKEHAFLNGLGQSLIDGSSSDSFFRTQFLGFRVDTVSHPFFLRGVAIDANGEYFETEVLFQLVVDTKRLVIRKAVMEY